ncbi:Rrf2 family nitric oxide-sensitive transcriptional repressor [Ensifer sp. KUDG1]|jgi:Rrf2 family nitric oxide-sensitive transcriptional repressor|uniref:Rrf2 family transcriptional regulator n=1 Tax=unclassified Ensifer TaxID=2633371 RepID=UPI000713445B|nr:MULTISPECIES: Rrf2 family transcriptional regulator [unclassified Ensifer]KQX54552.1 Rrf2 family transcriptional regulator [Ensifer sp. Root1298]KQX93235.1 Rrf2 family transcriptional regulator [Ensifer sp. Root1312]KRC24448.1 Rrf2 family transcriptional regulator [Ensifer sp. Root74]KRD79197.1 Rrf2 family transcriptional regulator [Ensifer sp. Root954]
MRLTKYTDYAMRLMIYLGSQPTGLSSIREISDTFSVSQNHMMKVVQDLANAGFLEAVRGRNGGIRLARAANEINLGALLRHTEELSDLIDCRGCRIAPACSLPSVLSEATAAFVAVFDKYTLADLVEKRSTLGVLLGFRAALPGEDCTL